MEYINRLIEKQLERKLMTSGCVMVIGPKFCGKSTMCKKFSKSQYLLNTTNAINLIKADPKLALTGEMPHLIDEWQKVPELWNLIKADLDEDYVFGKFIITGSTTPVNPEKIQHSGAGRITRILLKPFTLYESKESSGIVSVNELFTYDSSTFPRKHNNDISLLDIAYILCRGGWPTSIKQKNEYALEVTKNYYEGLFNIENESDEFSEFLKNKDISLLHLILKSYARNVSTQCKKSKIIKDIIESGERNKLDEDTFNKYYEILKNLFIIFELPAANRNLRSSVAVRTSPTIHFVDTSIATAALNIHPNDLINDLKSFGYFFEDLAIRDLSVYAQTNNMKLSHYRDSSGLEVDALIENEKGEYGAVEIKIYSENNIKEGIKSLMRFEEKFERSELSKPTFKMILTSHGPCYISKEGIYVVPINMLKN